jgi:hypothetical protein
MGGRDGLGRRLRESRHAAGLSENGLTGLTGIPKEVPPPPLPRRRGDELGDLVDLHAIPGGTPHDRPTLAERRGGSERIPPTISPEVQQTLPRGHEAHSGPVVP